MSLPTTKITFKDYDVLKQIGRGAFGIVYKVRSKIEKQIFALKTIDISKMDEKTLTNTLNEIRILCSVDHPNVVGYKEAFIQDKKICVVMEYVGGGDLYDKINKCKENGETIPEEIIWKYTVQILKGLKVLHNLKIMHRDIKSANIFLSDDHEKVKLGDLNLAKVAKDDFASTQIGTPYYLAPEIWLNERYDYRCDIFSLGCVLYEMAALDIPFDAPSINDLLKKVTTEPANRIPQQYSDELNHIIQRFMEKSPINRPTVSQSLELPALQLRADMQLKPLNSNENMDEPFLIKTITIPKNLKMLNYHLPKKTKSYMGELCTEVKYDNFDDEFDENNASYNSNESGDDFDTNRMRSRAMNQDRDEELNISNALKELNQNNMQSFRTPHRLMLSSLKGFTCENNTSIQGFAIPNSKKTNAKDIEQGPAMLNSGFSSDRFYNPFNK